MKKKDKKVIVNYLRKITGYKHTQLFRLIKRAEKGTLKKIPYHRIHPHRIYTSRDIKLLEKTDELHSVDEMTQWEIVVCAPQICEACMIPTIEEIIDQYPFTIFNFHWKPRRRNDQLPGRQFSSEASHQTNQIKKQPL
ncbi:MAG: hypothetical protein AAB800_04170 [Patescibacteria group bacterium]